MLVLLLTAHMVFSGTITINNNGATVQVQEDPAANLVRRATGQTFIVPAPTTQNRLTEFSFEIGGVPSGFDYEVFIYQWDGVDRPTGSPLFSSGPQTANAAGVVTFSGLTIDLTAGTPYIAFITTQGVVNDVATSAFFMTNNGNVYTDGENWDLTSTSTSSTALSATWALVAPGQFDMDFNATFGDVPVELQSFSVE